MIDILDSGPRVAESEIAQAERDLGRPLPAALRDFLLDHNGGYPREGLFALGKSGGRSVVQTFLRVQAGHRDDIRRHATALAGRLPAWLLPIGYDPGGNTLCVATAGPQTGHIYFWDHEAESDGPPTDEAAIPLAADFNEFLSTMTGG